MSPLMPLVIVFYKTLKDYDKDKPALIYVIAPRRNHKLAIEKAKILESKFKGVEVRVLIEGKDGEKIDEVIDKCVEANKVLSPSYW
jgi:predicted transcriptional regulator of viral defense system